MNIYIKKLIKEQFSISDLDFNDNEHEYDSNIFNKSILAPLDVYDRIIRHEDVHDNEITQLNDDCYASSVRVKDRGNLIRMCRFYSKSYPEDSMNWLDVSGITDMSAIFSSYNYNGDISKWDTSGVTDMHGMFYYSIFNNDISGWDVSHVRDMSKMFKNSKFNYDISKWDVSQVENMDEMFVNSPFNQDISNWNVDKVNVTQAPYYIHIWSYYMKDEYKPEKLRYYY